MVACGASREGPALQVDLLMIAAHTRVDTITLRPADGVGERTTVSIPKQFLNQTKAEKYFGITLEVNRE